MGGSPTSFLSRLEPYCELPVRRPKLVLAILLLVGGVLGSGVFRLAFDPSTEKVFPEGHQAVQNYADFRQAFGADEAVFLALEVPEGRTIYEQEALALSRQLAREAAGIRGVERAISIADVPLLMLSPLGQLQLVQVLPADLKSASPEAIERWRRGVESAPLIEGTLVSKDRRATSVVVRLKRFPDGIEGAAMNQEVVRALGEVVHRAEQAHPDFRFFEAGSPMIKDRIMTAIQEDLVRFTPPLLLIALIVAGLVLRSVRGPVLVVAVLILTNDLTLGAMGHLGLPLDPMTTLVPTLILVIGVADSLHLLVEQRAQAALMGPEATGAETILAAAKHTLVPCILTTATTVIGFASLGFSAIPPIKRFGIAAALAALLAFFVTFLLVPAACALLSAPRPAEGAQASADGLARVVLRRTGLLFCGALVLCVALALGWLKVDAETDFLAFFPEDDPMVMSAHAIQDRFSGIAPCEILIKGPPGCSRDPAVLRGIYALERALEQEELVDFAFSCADVVAQGNGLVSGKVEVPQSPADLARVEALLVQLAGGALPTKQFISPDDAQHPGQEWLRISVRARSAGSKKFKALADRIRGELTAAHLPEGVEAIPTGTSVVFGESADAIVSGQIESFVFAFVLITIVMTLVLRSLRLGLISVFPNLAPVAALLGTMGYLGIDFNSFSSMVGSIALGIAVDDTIHIMVGFRRASETADLREAVRQTLAREGMALISTSAVLFCGFGVLLLGTFGPTREFGLLTAVAIAVALLSDLVILPGLLLLFPRLLGGALPGADAVEDEAPSEASTEDEGAGPEAAAPAPEPSPEG